jgi:hypothetical protein
VLVKVGKLSFILVDKPVEVVDKAWMKLTTPPFYTDLSL